MKYKLIIYDLDGVIVDTEHLHYEAYRKTLKKYNVELEEHTYNVKLRSRGRQSGLQALMGPLTKEKIVEIGSLKDQHFLELIKEKPEIQYRDAIHLIERCKEKGIKIAIATASHQGKKLLEIYGMTKWFDRIISAQDIKNNKPDPEIYDQCKRGFKFADSEILVIEDSEAGIQAALASNLEVVFIKREHTPMIDEKLVHHPHVKMVQSLDELMEERDGWY